MKNWLFKIILIFGLFIVVSSLEISTLAATETKQVEPTVVLGQDIPDFSLNIVGRTENMTKENLLGRVYLFDFWRTTCKHCIEKMPLLHEVYNKYSNQGLVMVSISLDKQFSDVEVFRQAQWKMPCLHSKQEGGFDSEIARQFHVEKIPRFILVGRYGKILYTNETEDSDDNLKLILEKIMK
jgi:thiol-disulfide isomerase/thioredoxin